MVALDCLAQRRIVAEFGTLGEQSIGRGDAISPREFLIECHHPAGLGIKRHSLPIAQFQPSDPAAFRQKRCPAAREVIGTAQFIGQHLFRAVQCQTVDMLFCLRQGLADRALETVGIGGRLAQFFQHGVQDPGQRLGRDPINICVEWPYEVAESGDRSGCLGTTDGNGGQGLVEPTDSIIEALGVLVGLRL